MARLPKCPICDKEVEKIEGEFVKHSSKTYHNNCYQQFELRKQHRSELLEYICDLYNMKVPTGFILKQIKDLETDSGYTLKGIELSLRYFHEIEGNSVESANKKYTTQGIGIVPYVYENAKKFYTNLQQLRSSNAQIDYSIDEETIISSPPKTRKKKLIDINQI